MSYCEIRNEDDDECESQLKNSNIKIFYTTYGHGPTKVVLIIGLAGTHESWGPQIKALTGTLTPNPDDHLHAQQHSSSNDDDDNKDDECRGIQVCAFDNRGMGRSSIPTHKSQYTTTVMAKDAIALMDHLGWTKAHVFGHSMGAMIACKLAAIAPHRLLSLALLNVTGGGFQCLPKIDRKFISIAIRFLKAKTPEQRAAVDLDTHYTKEYLDEYVGLQTRRTILYQEYVKGISSSGMQSNYGFEGQMNACWTHKLTSKEIELIRSAGFLISVIHGRYDIIAQIYYARKLAEKLQPVARMVDLHGAHLVSHERPEEVNRALLELIEASESRLSPKDWSNLPRKGTGSQVIGIEVLNSNDEEGSCSSFIFDILKKLYLSLLYVFGLFVIAFEQGWRMFRRPMPIRVGTSTS